MTLLNGTVFFTLWFNYSVAGGSGQVWLGTVARCGWGQWPGVAGGSGPVWLVAVA